MAKTKRKTKRKSTKKKTGRKKVTAAGKLKRRVDALNALAQAMTKLESAVKHLVASGAPKRAVSAARRARDESKKAIKASGL